MSEYELWLNMNYEQEGINRLLLNSSGHMDDFSKMLYLKKNKRLFRKRVTLNMLTNLTGKRDGVRERKIPGSKEA